MRITRKWKKILSTALACLLLVGAVGAVASFAMNDSKPAGAVFKVGGLDPETGKYVKTYKTIYTETAIDAYGLRIEPDFESTVTYDVYYYDENQVFIKVDLALSEVYEQTFDYAKYCRIVIHPDIESELEEGEKEKDFKIRFYDIPRYASMVKIVNGKGVFEYNLNENLVDNEVVAIGKSLVNGSSTSVIDGKIYEREGSKILTGKISEDTEKISFVIKYSYPPEYSPLVLVFYDKDGNALVSSINDYCYDMLSSDPNVEIYKRELKVPEGAVSFKLSVSTDSYCWVYAVN